MVLDIGKDIGLSFSYKIQLSDMVGRFAEQGYKFEVKVCFDEKEQGIIWIVIADSRVSPYDKVVIPNYKTLLQAEVLRAL